MKIYNTLSRSKEELKTIKDGEVMIYVCGPTVYNYIHIGNARPFCVFDVLRRYLEYTGYRVNYVLNFTDIDDKIIQKANEEGVSISDISEKYIEEYRRDAKGLNILEATVHPKATENIGEIIKIISDLIDKGYAYESQGDVYFSTKKFDEYGKLSHQPLDDLVSGARISVGEIKKDNADFALWKKAKEGEPAWDSPWSGGRPGWHIECSAMSRRYLSDSIDIHCGGQDLIFPHHENEIAQSECSSGAILANYWMHNGYINNEGIKMSKSLGNFFTVRDVSKIYGYEPLRYFLISSHYRSPINYNKEVLDSSKAALSRLYNCLDSLDFEINKAEDTEADLGKTEEMLAKRKEQFCDALNDDLNTADAISAIFELVKDINKDVLNTQKPLAELRLVKNVFTELCGVLGLLYEKKDDALSEKVEGLIEARTEARNAKDWAKADAIRDELKEMGVVLEDTPQGIKWRIEK